MMKVMAADLRTCCSKDDLKLATSNVSIPNYLDGWEDTFEIPRHYGSDQIMAQLNEGYITESVRHCIVQEVTIYHYIDATLKCN